MSGADLASRSRESDIFSDPVMLLGPDAVSDAARFAGAGHRHRSASDRRDTPPVDVFSVSRQVSWLAGRRCSPSSQRVAASVTSVGSNSLLTVAGAAPDFRVRTRDSPASLLATKSRICWNRDNYMWCYSRRAVNGRAPSNQKFRSGCAKGCENLCAIARIFDGFVRQVTAEIRSRLRIGLLHGADAA
jgi:hypothetical protein